MTLSLGWREAFIVAVAVPVVFGLTLGVNLLFGYTINRVTLFALILSLGLLVDDPIVDVENIARHFAMRGKATREIVLEAVAEIRPPLISATLAVIVSFLPMFFITGMMGPYMAPMALNVPVAMLMSMVVAFTITPVDGLPGAAPEIQQRAAAAMAIMTRRRPGRDPPDVALQDLLPVDAAPAPFAAGPPLAFLLFIGVLTVAAMGLAATRAVPLKMLPFDNKNELLLVMDSDEGTTLERSNVAVQEIESDAGQRPRGDQFHELRGHFQPDRFQWTGTPLLPQTDAPSGGDPDQSGRQETAGSAEPRPGAPAARPADQDRREAQGPDQDRRAAARPASALLGRGRGLPAGSTSRTPSSPRPRHRRQPPGQGARCDRGR